MQIRSAIHFDDEAIAKLAMAAFGAEEGPPIVELIADLLVDPSAQPVLSLVASNGENVVGHVLFSRVTVESFPSKVSAAILAPLAVHPDFQSRGIGGRLINDGLRRLADAGVDLVFVLGHPGYYPRFGFVEAGAKGFEAPYPIQEVNAPAWMVQELRPGVIGCARGRVVCADTLMDPKYWRE